MLFPPINLFHISTLVGPVRIYCVQEPLPSIVVLGHIVCEVLGPHPGITLAPPAVEAWSFNSGTARETPCCPLWEMQCVFELNFFLVHLNVGVVCYTA